MQKFVRNQTTDVYHKKERNEKEDKNVKKNFKEIINKFGSNAYCNSLTRGKNNIHCFDSGGDKNLLKANLALSPCFLFSKSELVHILLVMPYYTALFHAVTAQLSPQYFHFSIPSAKLSLTLEDARVY